MNICLICNEYPPSPHGGIGTISRVLAQGLVENGFKVTVIGVYNNSIHRFAKTAIEYINKVKVIRLPRIEIPFLPQLASFVDRSRLFWWIFRENQKCKIDLIEVPDYEGMLPWGSPARIPIVCRGHGSSFYFDDELKRQRASRLTYYFEKKTLKNADHLVFVSDYVAKKTLELALLDRKYSVIYNGVDDIFFSPDKSIFREPKLIVFVNTIVYKKGVESLFDAMNQIFNEEPDAKLVLLGKSPNPGYPDFLLSKIPLTFRNQVSFLGHVDRKEVRRYMQKANVCIFPSYSEAFAVGPLEAMSVGSAVIFTKLSSGSETLEDGISGLLCDPYDPSDIAQKVIRVLRNGNLSDELGKNARKRVLRNFNRNKWINENVNFYKEIICGTLLLNNTLGGKVNEQV